MIDEPYLCPVPVNPDKPLRKPCNGSANSYFKHLQRGEPACDTSKRALALAKRRSRKTGLWDGTLPFLESEDDMHRRLLTPEQWDLWESRTHFKTSGPRPKRFEHEEFYADPVGPSDTD